MTSLIVKTSLMNMTVRSMEQIIITVLTKQGTSSVLLEPASTTPLSVTARRIVKEEKMSLVIVREPVPGTTAVKIALYHPSPLVTLREDSKSSAIVEMDSKCSPTTGHVLTSTSARLSGGVRMVVSIMKVPSSALVKLDTN